MKNFILSFFLILSALFVKGAHIDTVSILMNCMQKETKICIVTPENYKENGKKLPVLYLLHGYSGNYATWVLNFPELPKDADLYNMIIVCADGGFSSWYFDSPIDTTMKYETYITQELVPYIDQNYNTINDRTGRAISGLSMGGHGALYLAIRHQDLFGAAGSMSGAVDYRPFRPNFDLTLRLGDMALYPENWEKNTVLYQLYLLKKNPLAMIIDCGVNDFVITVNRELHQQLLYFNIPHDYIERPGGHNYDYWKNALEYQMLFFHKFFQNF